MLMAGWWKLLLIGGGAGFVIGFAAGAVALAGMIVAARAMRERRERERHNRQLWSRYRTAADDQVAEWQRVCAGQQMEYGEWH